MAQLFPHVERKLPLTASFEVHNPPVDFEDESLLPRPRHTSPFPVGQIAILSFVRLTEPIAFSQIFPYINTMILEFGIADQADSSGFYSGAIDSAFAVAQVCAIYHFGRLSDRFGRRPTLFLGLAGTILSTLLFGLSTSFPMLLLSRVLAGTFCGSSPVVSSSVGELVDEATQARAYPILGMLWPVGTVLGTYLGGLLFGRTGRWAGVFQIFLHNRPHFFPCLATATIAAASLIILTCYFEETLPEGTKKSAAGYHSSVNIDSVYGATAETNTIERKSETSDQLSQPVENPKRSPEGFRRMMVSNFLLSFIQSTFEVVFPLWAYTSVELGGLGRQPSEIGRVFGLTGVFIVLFTLFTFPILRDRFGKLRIYRAAMWVWPTLFIVMPLLSYFVGGVLPSSNHVVAATWTGLAGIACLRGLAEMTSTANALIVRSAVGKQGSLAQTFSNAQVARSVARAVAPTFASSLFSISVKQQLLRGNLVWVVLLAIGLCGAAFEPMASSS